MVAQVGPLVLAFEGAHRQHVAPFHADTIQLGEGLVMCGHAPRGNVVREQSHGYTPLHGTFHRGEEALRRRIERDDVELGVDEPGGGVDLGCHRIDGGRVVADEGRTVAADRRQGTEVVVLAHEPREPPGPVGAVAGEVELRRPLSDHPVQFRLLVTPLLRKLRVADEQEQDDADERDQEDGEQPGHGCGRFAIPRHDDQCRDADRKVDEDQDAADERR